MMSFRRAWSKVFYQRMVALPLLGSRAVHAGLRSQIAWV